LIENFLKNLAAIIDSIYTIRVLQVITMAEDNSTY